MRRLQPHQIPSPMPWRQSEGLVPRRRNKERVADPADRAPLGQIQGERDRRPIASPWPQTRLQSQSGGGHLRDERVSNRCCGFTESCF
ncbi:hypothetical protein BGZ61DRAFT_465770 [Ilyonectria robusta]|uniref:uncharacterized protein n=1 Tax=Ilyonectria robusta TaxID=1079257 RepID=UPI001E8D86AF|nr:uncharacterized protein BGZ61DRAFT_465770 [Ilyonectria robusta]KAH8658550.1 hypothetical protein BGZ61DRAFT_465770 [Ilyonectria robusta]